jgi:hypothetical protein
MSSSSHSAPSTPCFSPVNSAHRGGSRYGSGRNNNKRHQEELAHAGAEGRVSSIYRRQRLVECIASLSNPTGRSLSKNELRIIIRLTMWLQLYDNFTEPKAIELASVWSGSGRHTIELAYYHYLDTNELIEPDTSLQGKGNPSHPLHDTSLTLEQILGIHQLLNEAKLKNEYMPAKEIRRRLTLPIGVRQTRNIIKQLGYKWGNKRCIGTASMKQNRQRMRSFIRLYYDALQQEREGTAIIIYIDESYIHTKHVHKYCWYAISSPTGNQVKSTPSKGKRLILLHAMSCYGLLTAPRRGRSSSTPTNIISDEDLTCELIFEGLIDSEDYHKNMNGQIFMQWIENRLIPTFERKFPKKKLILILDNASYHHPHGTDWVNPNKMTKLELATWISDRVDHITVNRDGVSKYFGKMSLFQNKSNYSPTVDEMRIWMKEYLIKYPNINRTLLQQRFDDNGWQLIYTPPYQCDTQPIEMVWAYVKNYVGRVMGNDHSIETVTQLTRNGFYGDTGNNHAPVDDDMCQRLINHVHKWLNVFISNDDELEGSMDNLVEGFIPANDLFDSMEDEEEAQQMSVQDNTINKEEEIVDEE